MRSDQLVLILGYTGFVGTYLVENFTGSTRFTVAGRRQSTSPRSRVLGWDVTQSSSINAEYSAIVHAATPASAQLNVTDPKRMYELNVLAMSNVIEFAARHEVPPVVLFTSSGAVYGDMPHGIDRFPEGWTRPINSPSLSSAYAEGKIAAESLLVDATAKGQCIGLIARLFAFSGVHLPFDRHFAIGNFVRDAIQSQTISVRGDGSPVRSYLDGEDMAQWLLRIIEVGSPNDVYHVGSERAISIADLATLVGQRYELLTENPVRIEILGHSSPLDGVSRYVPSTELTRHKLGVEETITLEQSIDRMIVEGLKIL